jgi:hypothetical protein
MNFTNKLDDLALDAVAGGMNISIRSGNAPISSSQTGGGGIGSPGGPTCPTGPVKDQSNTPRNTIWPF